MGAPINRVTTLRAQKCEVKTWGRARNMRSSIGTLGTYWKSALSAALILAFMILGSLYIPEPIAQHLFRQKAAVESRMLAMEVGSLIQDHPAILQRLPAGPEYDDMAHELLDMAAAHRAILRHTDGSVLLATLQSDRAAPAGATQSFVHAITTGQAFFEHIHARPSEVGLSEDLIGSDEHEGLDVNHEIVPIKVDDKIVAAVEVWRDVSEINNGYLRTVRATILAISSIISIVGITAFVWSRRAARTFLRLTMERAEAERSSLSEQLRLAREVRVLGELNEWLQSCKSLEELFEMVARFVTHLLADFEGSIYVYSNSRDVLDGAVSWNDGEHLAHIHPEDCWGLRRGRTYSFAEGEVRFACAHVGEHRAENYLCIPFLAHGETVGMMHLVAKNHVSSDEFNARRALAQMCAEQVSLAIANVRMRDELHHQAIRDPLTGLFNRRHMMDTLRRLRETKRSEPYSIISIDVDHFKKFNDNFGHDAGDTVLRHVGEILSAACGTNDLACRMGGEELMLLLPGAEIDEALERAELIRVEIEKLVVRYNDGNLPTITVSTGVAQYPVHGESPQDVIRMADDALYVAKASGRNCVKEADGREPQKLAAGMLRSDGVQNLRA